MPDYDKGSTRRLNLGDTLTARINDTRNVKNPLIKLSQYFIYVQPRREDNEYMTRFRKLKEGELVTIQISEITEGYNGRWNCRAILHDGHAMTKQPSQRPQIMNAGFGKYLSFEHEYQCRFGNSMPSQEQIEALRKKWRQIA